MSAAFFTMLGGKPWAEMKAEDRAGLSLVLRHIASSHGYTLHPMPTEILRDADSAWQLIWFVDTPEGAWPYLRSKHEKA